ncbi:MAG: PDZ domain-containing protein, partial [Planctomycetota bacterium]
ITKIAKLMALLSRGMLTDANVPVFELDEGPNEQKEVPRARLTAFLGTIPDYAGGKIKGLKLSGVGAGGPAEKAGVRGGDIIVELAGSKIEDIYDYTYAIEALKIGETTTIVVQRGDKKIKLEVTPTARE